LAKEVFQIGDIYIEMDNTEKARTLYQQVLDEWPESQYVFNAYAGFIKADIHDGYDEAAMTGIDALIANYKDNSGLPFAVFQFGEQYWDMAQSERRKDNPMAVPPQILPAKQEVVISDKTKDYYTNAQNIWEKIIQDMPSSSMAYQAYRYAAEACKIIGQNDKAIEYFQAVVDNWPDDDMASHCLNMIADVYRTVQDSGALSQSEAESRMKQVYELLATDYPDSAPGLYAAEWLHNYENKITIQQRNKEAQKRFQSTNGRMLSSGVNNSNEGVK